MDPRTVSFRAALDARPISAFQWRLLAMAVALLIMDGYDTQAIGYVAPVLSGLWKVDRSAFAPIFSVGLVGLTLGALIFAPISDRIGGRVVLIGCTALYAVLTLATAFVDSWGVLFVLRFLTGFGLGGAMPSAIALVSDYSPTRVRNLMVAVAVCGFSLGGAIGGITAAGTMRQFGWQSVFIIGGIVPLITLPFLLKWLPETLSTLLSDPQPRTRLVKLVAELVPGCDVATAPPPAVQAEERRFPVAQLFNTGYAVPTLLIWVVFFSNLLLLFFFSQWIPTVVHSSGQSLETANLTAAVYQVGGTIGALVLAILCDVTRRPQRVLACAFIGAAVFCYLIGASASSLPALMACAAATGFCIVGGQISGNAFVGNYYPAAIRATGIGWALGIGRLGSIIGPLVGGLMISLQVPIQSMFAYCAIPALLAAVCVTLVRPREQLVPTALSGDLIAADPISH